MHALRNGSPLRKINTGSLEISKSKKAICQHFLSSFNRKIKRKSTPTNERMKLLLKLVQIAEAGITKTINSLH